MAEAEEVERVFTIPLREIRYAPRTQRAKRAVSVLRRYVKRHMRAREMEIWIDPPLNRFLWANGRENPPIRVRVRAVKFPDDNLVEVSLPEE